MTFSSFELLCATLCELEGAATPVLDRDEDGSLAITWTIDEVSVTLAHEPAHDTAHAFLFAAIGLLPHGEPLDACRALMDRNAALLRGGGACFSRHPKTGELMLQQAYAFEEGTPGEAHGHLRDLAAAARRIRHELALQREAT